MTYEKLTVTWKLMISSFVIMLIAAGLLFQLIWIQYISLLTIVAIIYFISIVLSNIFSDQGITPDPEDRSIWRYVFEFILITIFTSFFLNQNQFISAMAKNGGSYDPSIFLTTHLFQFLGITIATSIAAILMIEAIIITTKKILVVGVKLLGILLIASAAALEVAWLIFLFTLIPVFLIVLLIMLILSYLITDVKKIDGHWLIQNGTLFLFYPGVVIGKFGKRIYDSDFFDGIG